MKITVKKTVATALCLAALLTASGCGESETQAHKQLFAMDTVMTLTAYGKECNKGISAATDVITALEKELDPEAEGSPVYEMDNAGGEAVNVPGNITNMLAAAKTVYDRTYGALDLSVYPLSKLWGFIDLDTTGKGYVPTEQEIGEKLKLLCFDKIAVDGSKITVPAGGELSFGSVAKGYTSDSVISAMRQQGVEAAIVSLGGNVQTLGQKSDGSKWRVAVEDPNDTGSSIGTLSVGETAVITSGSYQRYFEKDGKTYHHIIDPRTGYPAESGLRLVTIVCPSGVTADCLSTAMFVLGKDKALEYWHTYGGFEMIMVTNEGELICTDGIKDSFEVTNENYKATFVK